MLEQEGVQDQMENNGTEFIGSRMTAAVGCDGRARPLVTGWSSSGIRDACWDIPHDDGGFIGLKSWDIENWIGRFVSPEMFHSQIYFQLMS